MARTDVVLVLGVRTVCLTWRRRAAGFCLAVPGRIRCLPRRAGSCPLSEAAAGGAHPRDSPDTKQTSRRAPQGSGSSPSFSASAQAKPHSSSFALQTHTSSSRLVKKMHLAADRYLSFLPAALYWTLHNFLKEKWVFLHQKCGSLSCLGHSTRSHKRVWLERLLLNRTHALHLPGFLSPEGIKYGAGPSAGLCFCHIWTRAAGLCSSGGGE